ncbi:hypothetical protein C0Q70_19600 [Pomacea canaliculata]|uniref:G-protein coupled receptors family 1 profile domain-containing protein n=1 Tax=Pomacea canaliculata TaxID=400727 RepID=A0A2T7NJT6_POMCA|nr:hypothetical protein C0Q70_19600 [Pomacea canaliculata]
MCLCSRMVHEGASLADLLTMLQGISNDDLQILLDSEGISSESELLSYLQKRSGANRSFETTVIAAMPEDQARKFLLTYVPPVLIVLGTLGNIVSFIVLRRRAMCKVSSYLYLASLAVADSLVLYIGLLRLWLIELIEVDFHNSSDWVCKLMVSFGYIASDLSVWMIIAVTVERYIVVCFPLRACTMCNTNRAKVVICFIALLIFCINIHFFWTVSLVEDSNNVTNCQATPSHIYLVDEIWPWVDACFYSFLPFVTILILNILIISEVVKARTHRQNLQSMNEYHYHQQRPQRPQQRRSTAATVFGCRRFSSPGEGTKLTVMLLTVSFTFLLTTLPMNISLIVTAFWNQQKHSERQMAQFNLAKTITELLMYVNHSINFFLYCATGQKFRKQIAELICCSKESYSSWTSMHTEHTPLSSLHSSKKGKKHLLMAHIPEDFGSSESDMVSIRTKV